MTVSGKRRMNTHPERTVKAVRHPAPPITYCVSGTKTNVPKPMPETAMPLARPRFFWNHRESTAEYGLMLMKVTPKAAMPP